MTEKERLVVSGKRNKKNAKKHSSLDSESSVAPHLEATLGSSLLVLLLILGDADP